MSRCDVALVFPPLWYYTSVPADLTYTSAPLTDLGLAVRCIDLSAALPLGLFREHSFVTALQARATYEDRTVLEAANRELGKASATVATTFGIRYGLRRMRFRGTDEAHLPEALRVGLNGKRNPALPLLAGVAAALSKQAPLLIGIALVYPSQRVQAVTLARLLRHQGYQGFIALYGSLQDEIGPGDFAEDLLKEPIHWLFRDVDAAIVGEAENTLPALCTALAGDGDLGAVPNLIAPRHLGADYRVERVIYDLEQQPLPDFSRLDPMLYLTPDPVVDLRMGRGCPWGRCGFCAIQAHHPGYRPGDIQNVARAMMAARDSMGSTFFRIRDDLVTPGQLRQLAEAIETLPFAPRWSVRARFHSSLTRETLQKAASAGLEELWLGLESAVPRVRALMGKGVEQDEVERILIDGHELGIRTRALSMIGFPGETATEARQTLSFLEARLGLLTTASVSPFELMRQSPMARRPNDFGIRLLPDTLPRYARLRYRSRATWDNPITRDQFKSMLLAAATSLLPRLQSELLPDAHHGWIAASVARSGWPC
ncbi:MAG: radical SAM protein [Proteobacteria bacterium]|jgi:hypothetical protein|nr:radical SAM protein [Pseudomonadota bacterium]